MEKFRRTLIEVFNGSELPFDARYYIFKDVYRDIFDLYNGMLEEQERASTLVEQEAEAKDELPIVEGTEVE